MRTTNPAQLERDYREAVQLFLSSAAVSPNRNSTLHLAPALGELFFPSRTHIVWLPPSSEGRSRRPQGATWSHFGNQRTVPLGEKALEILLRSYDTAAWNRDGHGAQIQKFVSSSQKDTFVIVLTTASARDGNDNTRPPGLQEETGSLWIIIEEVNEETRQYIQEFHRHSSGINFLFRAFRALTLAGRPAQLAAKVARIQRKTGVPFSQRLSEASKIIAELDLHMPEDYGDEYFQIIRRLAEAVMNEMIGVGWDVQNTEGEVGDHKVNQFLQELGSLLAKHNLADQKVLTPIIDIIRHTHDHQLDSLTKDPSFEEEKDLALMARWTYLYHFAGQCVRDRGNAQSDPNRPSKDKDKNEDKDKDKSWNQWALGTLNVLESILREEFKRCHEVRFLPSWLRLWFCHTLLLNLQESLQDKTGKGSAQPPAGAERSWVQRWRFRQDLAYVVRECLRHFRYGTEPNYIYQPQVFSNALGTLVEHHAIWCLNLPRDHDIRGILQEIGRISGAGDYYFAVGHLQHVLEIYIAGQFYCEFQLVAKQDQDPVDGWTMEKVLASRSAWKPGGFKRREFRKAFSLAALLHDVGMLLFPELAQEPDTLGRLDPVLRKNLGSIREVLSHSTGQLLETCDRELREEGYYDPVDEPRLARWIEDAIERGSADHCVLGAWYLHRICQNLDELASDTLRQAVRAILLHRVVTQPIEVDRDPAAALLVICDEIFMWGHGRSSPVGPKVGHSFQSLAVDVRPQATLFDYILIKGLSLEAKKLDTESSQYILGKLDLTRNREPTWPCFKILLKDPEYMETPVYFIWLAMAQNLGRIRASGFHWAPIVELWSKVPGSLAYWGRDDKWLLDEVANRASLTLRPSLERWLGNEHRFSREARNPFEFLVKDLSSVSAVRAASAHEGTGRTARPRAWERVRIAPLRSFHPHDIAREFRQIAELADQVQREEELFQREPRAK